ncbi:MAG: ATP-binding protein, partial [Anaerolineales bacterium]|nr:ATP-binding protein [Anaerolineales bacterium]
MTLSETLDRSIFKTRGPLDPVNDSAIYVPRPELEQLSRAAQATTVDAYLAILSSRQTGKTTLLYQLRHRLRPRGLGVALIDLAVIRDQSEDHLYRYVAGELRSELSSHLPRSAEKKDAALPANPIEFRRFMLDLARQVRPPRIVVLMDEVEAVSEKSADAFFGTVRNIFSSRRKEDEAAFEKYLLVLCGGRELHRLTAGPNSPLNIAERIYLKDFDAAGVQTLVAN